jgi:hypothetical protein
LVDKLVSLLAITSSMAGVVEFDAAAWFHRGGIAQQKINMLAVDLVAPALILVRPNYEKDIR